MLVGRRVRARSAVFVAVAALVAGVAGCAGGDGVGGDGAGDSGDTLVLGTAADPVTLDGTFVTDGESMRPIRQIFDTLVTHEPGGARVVPSLAERWENSRGGKTWTFHLEDDVTFTDGTTLDAEAVCANFDRWFGFRDAVTQTSASYFQTVFGAFADKKADGIYGSCAADDATTVTLNLTRPSASLLAALTLPAFAIASPTALEKYQADKVGGSPDQPRFEGTFGNKYPIGSGPFKLASWSRGDKLVLVRNDDYWGRKPRLAKVVLKPIADNAARRQALETGAIDGYEDVPPSDVSALRDKDFQMLERPAFTVAYIGFNQKKKPLDNLKIRQAIAYAIDRKALIRAKYGSSAVVADQFLPKDLFGYAPKVQRYAHDPAKAKQLIKESGVRDPTLEFWYPTNVNRSYMPDPQANFQAFTRDLEAVGFTVVPKTAPWDSGYLTARSGGRAPMSLSGWIADFPDPDNFLGSFFLASDPGAMNPGADVRKALVEARSETDQAKRTGMYQEINRTIMERLPGIPYASTGSVIALDPKVKGYKAGPVGGDSYVDLSVG
ncbi:MAG: ABC transporter substrate-binding protein [Streptosporangiales bacterium]|nr:ABC transporter substrate-binding protein [Streptosporangiales bacterium]